MDALRGLNPTQQAQEHHQVPGSSGFSGTLATASEVPSPGQPQTSEVDLLDAASSAESSEAASPSGSPSSSPPLEGDSAIAMDTLLCSTQPRSDSQQTPSPRHDDFISQCHQEMEGYYAELQALMGVDGRDNINMADSGPANHNPDAHDDNEHSPSVNTNMDDSGSSDDDRQPYRHGQMGVFKHFPRFDQASRPIVSGNWRDKKASDPARQLGSLMTGGGAGNMSRPHSPVTPGHSRANTLDATGSASQQRSPFVYTPSRSPLNAPANPNIAGFQPSPNPPPTPASLSTPISMAFPRGSGYGHAHHSSAGSFGTSNSYSPTSAAAMSTTLITSQMSSLGLRSNSTNNPLGISHANAQGTAQLNISTDYLGGNGNGTATFPVTIASDTLGYCFVRPNGTRTRLVPVDMLPYALQGIPVQEGGNERLVALPVPAGVDREGRSSNSQVLAAIAPPSGGNGGDAIQSHIDRILAAPPPAHHHHTDNPNQQQQLTPTQPSPHNHSRNYTPATPTHSQHSGGGGNTTSNKRLKVYCDKWVHEGVCAFTQQGCKYKHEMPSDTATQHQLGLFLGYPVWWKRRMQELARVTPSHGSSSADGGDGGGGAGMGERERGGGRKLMVTGGAVNTRLADGAGGGLGSRLRGVTGVGSAGSVGSGESDHADLAPRSTPSLVSLQPPRQNHAANGGLAASRWSNGPTSGNTTSFGKDKVVLPPLWRNTASAKGSPQPPYAEQSLQTYDGASSIDGREQVHYCPSAAELDRPRGLRANGGSGNGNGTMSNNDPRWPWDEQHYNLRAVQAQQQQQQQQHRPQSQPGSGGAGFTAACNFDFHTPQTQPQTSNTTTSPFGPIAPPMRFGGGGTNNAINDEANTSSSSSAPLPNPAPAPAPAREIANPYAYTTTATAFNLNANRGPGLN